MLYKCPHLWHLAAPHPFLYPHLLNPWSVSPRFHVTVYCVSRTLTQFCDLDGYAMPQVDIIWSLPPGTLNILMLEPAPAVFIKLQRNMEPFNATGNTVHLLKAAMGASNGKFPFFFARPDITPEVRHPFPFLLDRGLGLFSSMATTSAHSHTTHLLHHPQGGTLVEAERDWDDVGEPDLKAPQARERSIVQLLSDELPGNRRSHS